MSGHTSKADGVDQEAGVGSGRPGVDQRQAIRPGREVRQSRITDEASGRLYLLRVVVDTASEGDTVVTACRTSKIDKYWNDI